MISFLDLHKINARFKTELQQEFEAFLNSGQYILGDSVLKFENEYATYCGTKHCIGVASGLGALILLFKAYQELGVLKVNDEVIVPSNTYIATILAVLEAGLKPVLVAPNIASYNICPKQIIAKITPKTKVILAVHLYGQLAEMKTINTIAKANNLLVIEDAAQAHGALLNNKKAGNLSDAAAFSFYPSKNLGALGDGGAITTNNEALATMLRKIRNYGTVSKYINEVRGVNSRLDAVQARFLSVKLSFLDSDNQVRRNIAKKYILKIKNNKVILPAYNGSKNHVFHVFVVRVKNRTHFMGYLADNGVQTLIHYPIPPHHQQALIGVFDKKNYPVSEKIHQEIVSLPISPVQSMEETQTIINLINQY